MSRYDTGHQPEAMTLFQAQQDYQVLLEHHRARPEDEETWQLLVRVREQRDRLWLEHLMAFSERLSA